MTLESRKDSYKWDSDDSSGYRYDRNAGKGQNWNNGSYNFADDKYVDKNFGRINPLHGKKYTIPVTISMIQHVVVVFPIQHNGLVMV